MAKNNWETVGGWLFLLGVVIAIIGGFVSSNWVIPLMAILGFIVGIVNITDKEIDGYLLAVVALILLGTVASVVLQSYDTMRPIVAMLNNISVFAAFGGLVPALRRIYDIASSK